MELSKADYPCTTRCKSTKHGDIITAAITKRQVTDYELCCFLNYTCRNCGGVKDSAGRLALHVAASCGRPTLVKWLIQNRHANLHCEDLESRYTPLHKSIFYGKLHVTIELIKLGAQVWQMDADCLTMLDHAMKDGLKPDKCLLKELFVWGCNTNNSLGPQLERKIPELLELPVGFSVEKVVLEKFHSMILMNNGQVFACGHGQGGRLGLGAVSSVVSPTKIHFPGNNSKPDEIICLDVAVGRDHSLFLMNNDVVYFCGLNEHKTMGTNSGAEQILTPTPLKRFKTTLKGVACGRYHSLTWGAKGLYTWGLNAGQLGHTTQQKYILEPRLVNLQQLVATDIKLVSCSDAAIAVYTAKGDLYLLYENQCRRIASKQLNLVYLSMVGGKLAGGEKTSLENKELKIAVITNTGNLFLWQESDQQLCRCIFSLNRTIVIRHFTINFNEILFVTADGEGFSGEILPRKKVNLEKIVEKQDSFHKFLDKGLCILIRLKRLPRIHRAVYITSDPKGSDFVTIQVQPYRKELFSLGNSNNNNKPFFNETDDTSDITIQVETKSFLVHKYILSSHSEYFRKLCQESTEKIVLNNYNPDLFEQIIQYFYSGTCELLQEGEIKNKNLRSLCQNASTKNPIRLLQDMAKQFEVKKLEASLKKFSLSNFKIIQNPEFNFEVKLEFDRMKFEDLYDVKIKCRDKHDLLAHKVILAGRLEYFSHMFSLRWKGFAIEEISLPFSSQIVESVVDFAYKNTLDSLSKKDIEHIFKVLILSDHILAGDLKIKCEEVLSNLLTLKNVVQIFQFSSIYSAEILQKSCMSFITLNLPAILELNVLNELEEEPLQKLTDFYYNNQEVLWSRVITPYSTATSDETIQEIATLHPISLEEISQKEPPTKTPHKRRIRGHKTELTPNPDTIIQFPDSPEVKVEEKSIKLKINLNNSQDKGYDSELSTSLDNFPAITSPNSSFHKSSFKTPRIVKPSQKERKRLSSESSNPPESPKNPWEAPKNPWKVLPEPVVVLQQEKSSMKNIIKEEKVKKDNLVKITSKLLVFNQIEDKAMDELWKFYNCEDSNDEIITVERVSGFLVAAPVWVPKTK